MPDCHTAKTLEMKRNTTGTKRNQLENSLFARDSSKKLLPHRVILSLLWSGLPSLFVSIASSLDVNVSTNKFFRRICLLLSYFFTHTRAISPRIDIRIHAISRQKTVCAQFVWFTYATIKVFPHISNIALHVIHPWWVVQVAFLPRNWNVAIPVLVCVSEIYSNVCSSWRRDGDKFVEMPLRRRPGFHFVDTRGTHFDFDGGGTSRGAVSLDV